MNDIFKACDVRGIYGQDLTEEGVRCIGAAVAVLLRRRGQPARVVVGGDVRTSTPALKAALLEGLAASGAACLDVGIVPTPVFYFARRHLGVPAGVMVTASHNPASHNGLKIALGDLPVTEEDLREVRELAEAGAEEPAPGSIEPVPVLDAYCRSLAHMIRQSVSEMGSARARDRDLVRDRDRRSADHEQDHDHEHERHPGAGEAPLVVVDAGNGCWAGIAPDLVREAGYRVVALNDVPDGRFPGRDPNPSVAENLAGLCRAVVEEHAALGIAFDGDGDRVVLVDDLGRPVGTDAAAMLLSRALLASEAGARVVYDIKCSQAVADEVRRCGGVPLMERSGHTFLKTRVIRERALFGAEASGHYFFRALEGGDDGLYCALVFAAAVVRWGAPLSALVDALPRYENTPDIRIAFAGDPSPLLDAIAGAFPPEQVSRLDGVRVQFPEGWGLLRQSVTEAAITLRFEARTREALREVIRRFLEPVPELRRQCGETLC